MRVRKLGHFGSLAAPSVLYAPGEGVYRALAHASVGRTPLLPRLTYLCPDQSIDKDDTYPGIGLFLSPSIQNLKFTISGETDFIVNGRLSLLPPLVSACPNLSHLSLVGKESLPWQEIIFAISSIGHWPSLRHLTVHFPIIRDSKLFDYFDGNDVENQSMLEISFTKLQCLDIGDSAIEFSLRLLQHMSQAPLQTLRVESPNCLRTDQWSKLFKAVEHGISCSSLQHFRISYNHKNTFTFNASITFEALSPLLAFTCLTQVSIVNHGFDIDDENLHIMASAWTCLQTLELITLSPSHYQPRITINGLISLVQCCPSLAGLTIAFDASQAYLRAEGGARNERILTLGVSHSPVGDLDQIAALLSDMFPNLRSIDICQCRNKGVADHVGDADKRWNKVESLVARRSEV